MDKTKWVSTISLIFIMLVALLAFPATSSSKDKIYIGGAFALTGPFAEDSADLLAGFQDYAKYVNEYRILAPWYPDKKFPTNNY